MNHLQQEREEKPIKNGLMGKFAGWRINGKSYDANGNEIDEKHEKDCPCCREILLGHKKIRKVK